MVTGKAPTSNALQGDGVNARHYAVRSLRFVEQASVFSIAYPQETTVQTSLVLSDHTDALE
jgi:hypothetical protein